MNLATRTKLPVDQINRNIHIYYINIWCFCSQSSETARPFSMLLLKGFFCLTCMFVTDFCMRVFKLYFNCIYNITIKLSILSTPPVFRKQRTNFTGSASNQSTYCRSLLNEGLLQSAPTIPEGNTI